MPSHPRGACRLKQLMPGDREPVGTFTKPLMLEAVTRKGQEQGRPCADWCLPLCVESESQPSLEGAL